MRYREPPRTARRVQVPACFESEEVCFELFRGHGGLVFVGGLSGRDYARGFFEIVVYDIKFVDMPRSWEWAYGEVPDVVLNFLGE